MQHQRIKIIQSHSSYILESEINSFLETLKYEPIEIKFGSFGKYYEDDNKPWAQHIAYITYIENE